VERDVEAPEVFQVADQGLWDGRPSLGGVWVAHAEVKDPERVMIRNDATGEFVVGALFRRERENPGPRLQVSSDAATALGMLAGQPVRLSVVALRREEIAPQPPAAAPEADDVAEEAPTAVAEAPATSEAPTAETAVAEAPTETAPAATESRPRGLAALFRRRAPQPEVSAEAVAAGVETATIETQALENVTATAAAALDRAEAAAPAAPAPDGARNVSAPGAPDRPFVQIGIFSVEANAERAATMLRQGGHAAEIRREETSGRSYWRVLAGPATTGAERDRLIAAVKGLGFADAYAVRR
jgi:cell division septation protein DedD